jgi:hypothetical protein
VDPFLTMEVLYQLSYEGDITCKPVGAAVGRLGATGTGRIDR